jgi:hypothetical protein
MSGMSLKQAKALLADRAFQNQVLVELRGITDTFSTQPELIKQVEQGLAKANILSLADVAVLPEETVTPGRLRPEQKRPGKSSRKSASKT